MTISCFFDGEAFENQDYSTKIELFKDLHNLMKGKEEFSYLTEKGTNVPDRPNS